MAAATPRAIVPVSSRYPRCTSVPRTTATSAPTQASCQNVADISAGAEAT